MFKKKKQPKTKPKKSPPVGKSGKNSRGRHGPWTRVCAALVGGSGRKSTGKAEEAESGEIKAAGCQSAWTSARASAKHRKFGRQNVKEEDVGARKFGRALDSSSLAHPPPPLPLPPPPRLQHLPLTPPLSLSLSLSLSLIQQALSSPGRPGRLGELKVWEQQVDRRAHGRTERLAPLTGVLLGLPEDRLLWGSTTEGGFSWAGIERCSYR